jgi:hypothetical protein
MTEGENELVENSKVTSRPNDLMTSPGRHTDLFRECRRNLLGIVQGLAQSRHQEEAHQRMASGADERRRPDRRADPGGGARRAPQEVRTLSLDDHRDRPGVRPICDFVVPPGLPVEGKCQLVKQVSAAIVEACNPLLEEIALPSGKKVSTRWVLAFFSEYPLEQAALDDLMAFENPMVLEGMEAAMQMEKKGKSRSAQSA